MLLLIALATIVIVLLFVIELALWGLLIRTVAFIGFLLHISGLLEPILTVAGTAIIAALAVALVWAGIAAIRQAPPPYGFGGQRRSGIPVPPTDPEERYLWANRLGRYGDGD